MLSAAGFRYAFLAAIAVGPITAHAQGRALAIEDFYRLKSVGAPQMSPDGRWVAYTVVTRIEATNSDSSEVWLASATTSATPRRVSAPGTHATAPQWDGGQVTFSAAGRRWSVHPATPDAIVELPGVTPHSSRGARTFPSPDGRRVATLRNMPVPRSDRAYASEF